jgi:fatty-acyl-CoA synthase
MAGERPPVQGIGRERLADPKAELARLKSYSLWRALWFHTEDLCSMDEEGLVTFHARLKLMLKVGGENVSLEEVERVVNAHDAVMASCAVGIEDARKGEAVYLYVRRMSEAPLDDPGLRDWLATRLAHFKLPREIVFIDERMPYLGNGKLDRVTLRTWARERLPLPSA